MKCSHCGELAEFYYIALYDHAAARWEYFCEAAHLRAWLGPDRPVTERTEAHQSAPLSPQPIVVPTPELEPREGESAVAYLQRLMEYGLFEKG
jgi:hypothetical protein